MSDLQPTTGTKPEDPSPPPPRPTTQSSSASSTKDDKTMGEHGQELFTLVKEYAKQETIDPLRSVGRFLRFGLGAALLGGIGIVLLVLGVLRLLQTETDAHLTGSLTWIPYSVGLVVCVLLILLALKAIKGPGGKQPEKGAR